MFAKLKSQYYGTSTPAEPEEPKSREESQALLRKAVENDITPEVESYVTNSCLDRFLRARNDNIERAGRMLQGTLKWRHSYRPDTLLERQGDLLKKESETGKMYVLPKADVHKRATVVMRPGLENSQDTTGKIANLVYTLERAATVAEQSGGERFVVIVDYARGTISSSTMPSLSVSKETTNILQNHYPERLACMVLVSAPRLFHAVFKVLKPLIDVKTREKIHFVEKSEDVVTVDGIDIETVPKEYGGNYDYEFTGSEKYFQHENIDT